MPDSSSPRLLYLPISNVRGATVTPSLESLVPAESDMEEAPVEQVPVEDTSELTEVSSSTHYADDNREVRSEQPGSHKTDAGNVQFSRLPKTMTDNELSAKGWRLVSECMEHPKNECWEHHSLQCAKSKSSTHFSRPRTYGRLQGGGDIMACCHSCRRAHRTCGIGRRADRYFLNHRGEYIRRSSASILVRSADSDSEDDEDNGVKESAGISGRKDRQDLAFNNDLEIANARRSSLRSRATYASRTSRSPGSNKVVSKYVPRVFAFLDGDSETDTEEDTDDEAESMPTTPPVARFTALSASRRNAKRAQVIKSDSESELNVRPSQKRIKRRVIHESSDDEESSSDNISIASMIIVRQPQTAIQGQTRSGCEKSTTPLLSSFENCPTHLPIDPLDCIGTDFDESYSEFARSAITAIKENTDVQDADIHHLPDISTLTRLTPVSLPLTPINKPVPLPSAAFNFETLVAPLRVALIEKDTETVTLRDRVARAEAENNTKSTRVQELEAQIASLNKLLEGKDIANSALGARLKEAETRAADKDETIARLEKELTEIRGHQSRMTEVNSALEIVITQAQSEQAQIQAEASAATLRSSELEASLQSREDQINDLKWAVQSQAERLVTAEKDRDEAILGLGRVVLERDRLLAQVKLVKPTVVKVDAQRPSIMRLEDKKAVPSESRKNTAEKEQGSTKVEPAQIPHDEPDFKRAHDYYRSALEEYAVHGMRSERKDQVIERKSTKEAQEETK